MTPPMNSDTARYMTIRGLASTAQMRAATFDGREHLVVTTGGLRGDMGLWPVNSDGPEFVPARELAKAPSGWDGRPVMPNHPEGGRGSANVPATLERFAFGRLFHTRFEGLELRTEAWLDPEQAKKAGAEAESVIRRARAGQPVEVSIGAFIMAERKEGSFNGEPYQAVWHDIVPDHLAMLPEGVEGACSVDAGCGIRYNQRSVSMATKAKAEKSESSTSAAPLSFIGRLMAKARESKSVLVPLEEGMSDHAIWSALWEAIRSTVPAFDSVVEYYPDDKVAIYTTSANGEYQWHRCSYEIGEDGKATLSDAEQVEPTMTYEVVGAAKTKAKILEDKQTPAALAANKIGDEHAATTARKEAVKMCNQTKVKELAGRLIASAKSPFEEADRVVLEAFSEDKLTALNEAIEAPKPAEATAGPVKAEEVKKDEPKTDEEAIAALPQGLQKMFHRYQAEEAATRSNLVAQLSKAQQEFDAKALEAKPTEELTSLARMLGLNKPQAISFVGRGLVGEQESGADDALRNPPDAYDLAGLEAARKGGAKRQA